MHFCKFFEAALAVQKILVLGIYPLPLRLLTDLLEAARNHVGSDMIPDGDVSSC